ncbi:long-chain fatty acid--CoA ligase [uncultured Jatrophihabitans sp.]|uniref:long-chain fatty acid--CoA ligase n=1 Tax=uncultured Jatrophihabitans sp. TaxID=1610747 RepID=UPI0035CBE675
MLGLMQDFPLTTNAIFARAERYFPDKEIVTRTVTGVERMTVADVLADARRIATYLDSVGVSADGRVGTFGWNTARHLALYFAIPGTGRVMHTINIRYFAEQLIYTVNHAEDEAIFVDRSLLPALAGHLPQLETVRHVVVMDDGADASLPDDPRVVLWSDVVAPAAETDFADRVPDERNAAALCYTTGTTGNPKGVLYSHRSTWLHSNSNTTTAVFSLSDRDRVLPVVPMFHANAWGLPYGSMLAGASMIFPGPDLSPGAVLDLLEGERVTVTAGVPTIWMGMLPQLADRDLSALRMIICGGSAVPRALSETYREKIGLPITQAWGMTETSPIATVCVERAEVADADDDALADLRATAGMTPPGVELRIVEQDTRAEQPWDDTATGELEVRGAWIAARYFRTDEPGEQFSPDGWLRTGDVAAVSPLGYVRLVDRTKDLVKSGGEWISSVHLENVIMSHPDVAEAAVIAVPHPKWAERPLACVVPRPGATLTREDVLEFLGARLSKWQVPDDVVFLDEVPKTSVGKFSKRTLRDKFAGYQLPTR